MTVYHLYGPSKALPTIIDYEADRFQHLDYTEEQFKTEAGAILGEYAKSASNPSRCSTRRCCETRVHQAHLSPHGHRLPRRRQGDAVGLHLLARVLPPLLHARQRHRHRRRRLRQEGDAGAPDEGLRRRGRASSTPAKIPVEPPQTARAQRARRLEDADAAAPVARLAHAGRERPRRRPRRSRCSTAYLFGPTSPLYQDLVLGRQLVDSIESSWSTTAATRRCSASSRA